MIPHRFAGRALALVALLAGATAPRADETDGARPLSTFPRERIVVETHSARRHVFEAWRADTLETRAQGLMFVTELRPDQAMIFVYDRPQLVSMWMKNTLLALDMLFVDEAGCIVKLHEQARPGSLATIAADVPVTLVVEVAGGRARELAIGPGDRVTRPEADWPDDSRSCSGRAR
jgi:uncharacterized membrane protein (UPF0127 family)